MNLFREFFFLFKKIAIIIIISFANVGSGQTLYQNNGFFILIFICFCFWIKMNQKPFINEKLNSFDLQASIVMILTIFSGLFSSVCENSALQIILMILTIIMNINFLLIFIKNYFQIKLFFTGDTKIKTILFLKSKFEQYWSKGILIF